MSNSSIRYPTASISDLESTEVVTLSNDLIINQPDSTRKTTLASILSSLGIMRCIFFSKGGALESQKDTAFCEEDGKLYIWNGPYPKLIEAGSTPETSGGVGPGAWVSTGADASFVRIWKYHAVVDGETTIQLPTDIPVVNVQTIYVQGLRQDLNEGFTYNANNHTITLADELEAGDLVTVIIGIADLGTGIDIFAALKGTDGASNVGTSSGGSVQDVLDNLLLKSQQLTDKLVSNNGASNIGTLDGITVEEALSNNAANIREHWRRQLSDAGLNLVDGSFEEGATVSTSTDAIWYMAEGQCYTWDGDLPKIVPAGSTPDSTGGVKLGAWSVVSDASLRSEVYSNMAWVSPEMYGATDAISSADTQALIDAFATAKAMGVGVKLSRLYRCASNITLTSFISDVFGLGQGQTGIIFEPGLGIIVDNSLISGTRKAMRIINTSLRTRGDRDATALRFKGTHTAKYGEQLKLTDVLFATDETGAFGWDCCVHLDQASQVFMDHCSMSGLDDVPTNCCIRLTNQSRDVNFTNGCASDFLDFLDSTSGSEGVTVAFNHIIAGQRGIVSHDTGGNMIFVLGNHFNTSISAVELGEGTGLGSNHCKIANNFCIVYNKPGDESKPYVAFDICSNENVLSSNDVLLTGFTKDATHTRLRRNTSATRSASNNTISNPISNGLTRGVVIATGAVNNQVFGNQRIGMTLANDIVDNGTNTRYWLLDSDNNSFLTGDIKLARPGMAGVRQLRVHTGLDTTTASGILRFIGGADGVANDAIMESTFREVVTKTIRPSTTNAYSCGVSGAAWSGGFTQTAFTVTSDERAKTEPVNITDAMLDAWSEVDFVQFQYVDRVEAKGADGARWHFGVIAQRAMEAFARHGLDATKFGFFCHDEWEEQAAIYDKETGEELVPAIEAGDRYGIRYEEALALEASLQRRNYARLLDKYETLEARISSLENK